MEPSTNTGLKAAIFQFIRFGIVGVFNTFIDLGVLNLLIWFSGISAGIYFSVFKGISFIAAVTNSYFWNKYWTFKAGGTPLAGEFGKFFAVNLIGFAINVGTASLVVNLIGAPVGISGQLWANIGAIAAVGVSLIWNFTGMKFIVFRK